MPPTCCAPIARDAVVPMAGFGAKGAALDAKGERTANGQARRVAGTVVLLLVWVLFNPYFEIDRSSLIYAGRALADLDPSGVGRDPMFQFDGQSRFTPFTGLYRLLVTWSGLATATLVVSIASIVASFCGACALAATLCAGSGRALAIVYAATLPACYGGYKLFSYAETAATPRPFTEALVLFGVAALARGRHRLAAVLMLAALVLHPIMGLAGVLVLAAWLVIDDRRWLLPIAGVAILVVALALSHVAPFDRLTVLMDADWRAILVDRNPHLFPSLWPEGWMGRASVRIATILVAASLANGPVRRLLLVCLAVGLLGLGVAYLLDQRLPIVLLVQAQTWRSMWLVFSIATAAAALCTIELWRQGGTARIVLALLALGWIYADHDTAAMVLAVAALAFRFCLRSAQVHPTRAALVVGLGVAVVLGLIGLGLTEWSIAAVTREAPAGYEVEARHILALDWEWTPLAILAAIVLVGARRRFPEALLVGLAAVLLLFVVVSWDRRSQETRGFDHGDPTPALAALVAGRPGAVFWLGSVQDSWRWLGRPNWISSIQGAGLVFSRPLSMLYRNRSQRALEAGLDDGGLLHPFDDVVAPAPLAFDAARIRAFCAAPDAPAWIVAPIDGGRRLPRDLHPIAWSLPSPRLTPTRSIDGALTWRWTEAVDVIGCGHGAR